MCCFRRGQPVKTHFRAAMILHPPDIFLQYVRDIPMEEFELQKEEVEEICWMAYEACMGHVSRKDTNFCIHPDEYRKVCEYIKMEVLSMEDKEKNMAKEAEVKAKEELSPTWNEDCLTELDEWIESQGIYLRQ